MAAAFIYVWIVPLFLPRGEFLWGHYRLKDIYAGIPVALATFCFVLIFAVPKHYRRALSLRAVTVTTAILVGIAVSDAMYAFAVVGILRSNYWLDQVHISRRHSAADPELGFVRKPLISWRGYIHDVQRVVQYRTDKNGFRNPTHHPRADIVFVGDSFTESATVAEADTFVRRVAHSTGLSAVNLGRGAYGPQQELIVLKRYGLAYQPQFVVWELFEGNDLSDAEAFATWRNNPHQANTTLKERYFDNSLLKQWLTSTRSQTHVGPMATLRYHDGTSRRVSLRYAYEPDAPARMHSAMSETMNAIEAGHRLCESRGIKLLVVVVPTMVRAMAPEISFDRVEDREKYLPVLTESKKDFSGTIEELCDRIGCTFVDGLPAFRQAAAKDNRNLYIPNDEHLDVGGHEVMAQIVARWIRAKDTAHPSE